MRLNLRRSLLVLLLPAVTATGCTGTQVDPSAPSDNSADSEESLEVVATVLPVYLFTKAVAGDAADVSVLIKPGTEVHDYQSTPADVRTLAQADVLVKNGLGLEAFLDGTIASAQNSKLTVIDASENISPLDEATPVIAPAGEEEHAQETGTESTAEHDHAENPHVWLDPVLAIQQVETIRDGLAAADPENAQVYQTNAAAYIEQLQALDRQFKEQLQPFSNATFVSFHDAYPYLAERYNLQQVAIVALPEDNLTPQDIQKTVATVKQYNVKALFGEPGVDNRLLNSLSQDLNLELKPLDPLEAGELDPQYYFTAMKTNLTTLASAFQ